MGREFLSPKDVAGLLHISVPTVNYYTNLGLLRVEERKGNKRLYDKNEVLVNFAKIKQLRKQGYSLKLIRQHLYR